MTCRILLFGRTGQVATEILRLARPGLAIAALGRAEADLRDPDACAAAVAGADADVIINAAAWTAVDDAEKVEAEATVVNASAPGAMARAAAARGLPFLHISTDYVFDGHPGPAWKEDDKTAPLSAYGRSKLSGEIAVQAAGGWNMILRTAWVFAGHGQNFPRTMLRVGATRDRLSIVDDQTGGPTAAADIAASLVAIGQAAAAGNAEPGTFHFCGTPAVSWFGFATEIFRQADWMRAPELGPIGSEEWPAPAPRPRNSVLDCSKIARSYGIAQPDWRRALGPVLNELKEATP